MAGSLGFLQYRLDRAKEHIDELESEIGSFLATDPYEVVTYDDTLRGERVSRLDRAGPIPPRVPILVGEVVHALRATLDNFAHGVVPGATLDTGFPIWRQDRTPTPAELKALVHHKVNGAPQLLLDGLKALETYPGGNAECLWVIGWLDNTDKHRLLLPVTYSIRSYRRRGTLPAINLPAMRIITTTRRRQVRVEQGSELLAVPFAHADKEDKPTFTFGVAFGEPQVVLGEPVAPTLAEYVEAVTDLLETLLLLV